MSDFDFPEPELPKWDASTIAGMADYEDGLDLVASYMNKIQDLLMRVAKGELTDRERRRLLSGLVKILE